MNSFFKIFFSWSKCKRQLQLLNQIFLRAPHTSIGVPKIKQSLSNLVPSLFLPGLAWFCTFGQYFFIMSENHNQITITVFSQYFYNNWQLLGSKNIFLRDFQGYTRFHYSCLHLKVRQRGRNFKRHFLEVAIDFLKYSDQGAMWHNLLVSSHVC